MDLKLAFYNIWYSLFYRLTAWLPDARIDLKSNINTEGLVVVTLTTKPSRINKVWMVIESLLRQKEKPDAVFLYIPKDEFQSEHQLPSKLISLKNRGLQIVFVDNNLKPHNKYYYAMKSFPKANVVTVDDDKIYPETLIQILKAGHSKHPKSICAIMTRSVQIKDGKLSPYTKWPIYRNNSQPSHTLVGLGVCGVLYPPKALHPEAFDAELLKKLAWYTDDLWIKVMALRNGTKVVSLNQSLNHPFISLRGTQFEQLTKINIAQGENDAVMNRLLEWFKIPVESLVADAVIAEEL